MSVVVDDATVDEFVLKTPGKNLGKRGRSYRDGRLPPADRLRLRERIREEIGKILKADVKRVTNHIKTIAQKNYRCVHPDLANQIRIVGSIYKDQLEHGVIEIGWYQHKVRKIYNNLLAAVNPESVEFVDNVFA